MAKQNFAAEEKKLRALLGSSFPNSFLAGGAITSVFTNQPVNDLDLYFRSFEDFSAAVEEAYKDGAWCVALSRRAITFKLGDTAYQLMYFRFFDSAEQIFERFDFTACMAALDTAEGGQFSFHPRFVADACQRKLVFNHNTDFPIASGVRVQKYLKRGFTIDGHEWMKILLACMFCKVTSWDELETQLGGHYGDSIKLGSRDKELTLDNAIAALSTGALTPQIGLIAPEEPPATFDEAMGRIDAMRGES